MSERLQVVCVWGCFKARSSPCRFARAPDGRAHGGPRGGGGGEGPKRPSILKQDDLKELDELDHDGDEGWAGQLWRRSAVNMHTRTRTLHALKTHARAHTPTQLHTHVCNTH